ncbi:hypothetical protein CAEBREN_11123 [Caenorhabditis brenneri]|uniref:Zinc finger PHD-type domain-containing protein n=1 Tax=Caenorhabditis brenneri TaxID=135651 RepID=G0MX79_CAEBE|nr:hypothetical protein CAEBREN_11123 [Caenorhabditis brenneri]
MEDNDSSASAPAPPPANNTTEGTGPTPPTLAEASMPLITLANGFQWPNVSVSAFLNMFMADPNYSQLAAASARGFLPTFNNPQTSTMTNQAHGLPASANIRSRNARNLGLARPNLPTSDLASFPSIINRPSNQLTINQAQLSENSGMSSALDGSNSMSSVPASHPSVSIPLTSGTPEQADVLPASVSMNSENLAESTLEGPSSSTSVNVPARSSSAVVEKETVESIPPPGPHNRVHHPPHAHISPSDRFFQSFGLHLLNYADHMAFGANRPDFLNDPSSFPRCLRSTALPMPSNNRSYSAQPSASAPAMADRITAATAPPHYPVYFGFLPPASAFAPSVDASATEQSPSTTPSTLKLGAPETTSIPGSSVASSATAPKPSSSQSTSDSALASPAIELVVPITLSASGSSSVVSSTGPLASTSPSTVNTSLFTSVTEPPQTSTSPSTSGLTFVASSQIPPSSTVLNHHEKTSISSADPRSSVPIPHLLLTSVHPVGLPRHLPPQGNSAPQYFPRRRGRPRLSNTAHPTTSKKAVQNREEPREQEVLILRNIPSRAPPLRKPQNHPWANNPARHTNEYRVMIRSQAERIKAKHKSLWGMTEFLENILDANAGWDVPPSSEQKMKLLQTFSGRNRFVEGVIEFIYLNRDLLSVFLLEEEEETKEIRTFVRTYFKKHPNWEKEQEEEPVDSFLDFGKYFTTIHDDEELEKKYVEHMMEWSVTKPTDQTVNINENWKSFLSESLPPVPKTQKKRRLKQLDESESEEEDLSLYSPHKDSRIASEPSSSSPCRRSTRIKNREEQESEEESETAQRITSKRRRNLVKKKESDSPKPPKVKVDHRRRINAETVEMVAEPQQQQQASMTPEEMAKDKCGVAEKFCFCARWDNKRVLEWVECMKCGQWFHILCVRLNNIVYSEEEVFICCGASITPDAQSCKEGKVFRKYKCMSHAEKKALKPVRAPRQSHQ